MAPTESVDLNLLTALDVLLAEGSVTGAARRLGLSASAMSRTLARLRASTGDPLLVRAGRSLVPTPRAAELRDRVHSITSDAHSVLRPASRALDLASLDTTFTLGAAESFLQMLASAVVAAVTSAAPHVRLHFSQKKDGDVQRLRDGVVDLEIGRRGASAPEILTKSILRDRYVGVARSGHSLFASGKVTARRYAACHHVVASQGGDLGGAIDVALAKLDLARAVPVVVPGYPDAMRIARTTDLVAMVPHSSLGNRLVTDRDAAHGLRSFELPVRLPGFTISAMWHPRNDADPAQRWLRALVIAVGKDAYP